MSINKFWKGIFLMLSVLVAAIQSGQIVWAVTFVTMFLVGAQYYVKNYFLPSDSLEGSVNRKDVVSTILLAIIAGLSDTIGQFIVNGVIILPIVGKTVLSVIVTYFTTSFFSGAKKTV
jgi:magnesium-transporting ATPase (P-type)